MMERLGTSPSHMQHCNSSTPFFKFYFIVCSGLATETMPFMKTSYTSLPYKTLLYSSHPYNYYVHGTFARYSCTKNQQFTLDVPTPGQKMCLNGTWSGPEPRYTMCGKCL